MLSGWMLYCLLVSGLLLAAGRLLEEAARRLRVTQRWIWAGALGGSALLPLLSRFRPEPAAQPADVAILVDGVTALSPLQPSAEVGSRWGDLLSSLPALDPILLGFWAGASGVLLIMALLSMMRLRRAMRGWEGARLGSREVLVSEATGPAVVGLLSGAIVLPRWAMAGDSDLWRLMVAHEEEHIHARDPLLLHLAAALVVLLPWNLPLWWQLRRLKLAVEVDCDARVLGRGLDLRSYASLLLEVGRRRAGLERALVAFAEPASFLERRIRIMTSDRGRRGWLLASACAALSVAFVAGACAVERPADEAIPEPPVTGPQGPLDSDRPGPEEEAADTVVMDNQVLVADSIRADPAFSPMEAEVDPEVAVTGREPAFSPRDVEPALQNVQEFTQALERAYPAMLRDAGIGGRVLLWVFVNAEGRVSEVRVNESSGYEQIDEAAMRTMRSAEFSPALLDGRPVAVWVALPVTLQTAEPAARAGADARADPLLPAARPNENETPQEFTGRLSATPAFTPREEEPRLQNTAEFTRALERAYPAALKQAGIGGRALLWVFVDEQGRVGNVRLFESSGYEQLDKAALATMRTGEFTPALNRGETVPVWVAIPVTFAVDR